MHHWPMIGSGGLSKTTMDAIARKIVAERMWQCKMTPAGGIAEPLHASQSRISAIAAGAACTSRMRRLTVTAP